MINKAAPDFCSVYVIAKGKAQSTRPAARQADSSTPPRLLSPQASVEFNHSEPEDGSRYSTHVFSFKKNVVPLSCTSVSRKQFLSVVLQFENTFYRLTYSNIKNQVLCP